MARKPDIQYIRYYTDGSAARQIKTVRSAPSAVLPTPRKLKRKVVFVDPVAIAGIVVAVSMLILMTVGIVEFVSIRQEAVALENYVEQLSEDNRELTDTYKAGYNLEDVEKTALSLGMVPAEQVEHVQIQVGSAAPEAEKVTLWDQLHTFLAGLFA